MMIMITSLGQSQPGISATDSNCPLVNRLSGYIRRELKTYVFYVSFPEHFNYTVNDLNVVRSDGQQVDGTLEHHSAVRAYWTRQMVEYSGHLS